MATMYFNWDALATETPEAQYDLVLQVARMLPDDEREEFTSTEQFHNWLHSPEMDVIFKAKMQGDDEG